MKVYGPGFYTVANKGDAALVDVYIKWLRAEFGVEEVVLSSFTPDMDGEFFGIDVLPMITSPYRTVHRGLEAIARRIPQLRPGLTRARLVYIGFVLRFIGTWSMLRRRSPRLAAVLAPRVLRRHCEAIESSDLAVAVPGGYLNALEYTDDWWLFHLPSLKLATSLGRPLMLAPCSVGPFHPAHVSIAKSVLSRCTVVMVREDTSARVVEGLGVPRERIIPTPDLGFEFAKLNEVVPLPADVQPVVNDAVGRELLGISVRRHSFPGCADPRQEMTTYLSTVADAASAIQAESGCVILIIPQTLEDLPVGESLAALLGDKRANVVNLVGDYSPRGLCAIYAELRLLIGTRMHANILAMSVGTPVAAIGYEPKTMGILERVGASSWGLEIDALDQGRLMDLTKRQWDSADQLRVTAARMADGQAAQSAVATDRARRLLGAKD